MSAAKSALGWANSVLLISAIVGIGAKITGVVLAPGARGVVGERTVNMLDTLSGAFSYTLTALLVALVCGASFELARARNVNVAVRGLVVAVSGLVVALASPAVVERLTILPSLALAIITSLIALAAGIFTLRAKSTRIVGGIITLLSVCGVLRIVAWETSSSGMHDLGRVLATIAVGLHSVGVLVAAAWVGTRSKLPGRILANLAIVGAFALTWLAHAAEQPNAIEQILRTSLGSAVGSPVPYGLSAIAAFLVPASIFLAIATIAQPKQHTAIMVALAFALLSHGSYDVPLHALLITASAQWTMLVMGEQQNNQRFGVQQPTSPPSAAIV